jgi:hypothetical protein
MSAYYKNTGYICPVFFASTFTPETLKYHIEAGTSSFEIHKYTAAFLLLSAQYREIIV